MLENHIRTRVKDKGIAVMGHIVCGFPSFDANWEILEEMEIAGVDAVEMQFPFSEPIADGPLFLAANQQSLERGTKIADCFSFMKKASAQFSFPFLMMGYYNTVFKTGEESFCGSLRASGGVGMIIPDLPIEEAGGMLEACARHSLAFIRLVAPTTTRDRLKHLVQGAEGFIYAAARKGVTGKGTTFTKDREEYFTFLKEISGVPIAVGFGVSQKGDLDYLCNRADMAVIGTAVLQAYMKEGRNGVKQFFAAL